MWNLEEVVLIAVVARGAGWHGKLHVETLIQNTDESAKQQDDFRQLLNKYSNVLSKGDHDLVCATAVKHRINTGYNAAAGRDRQTIQWSQNQSIAIWAGIAYCYRAEERRKSVILCELAPAQRMEWVSE